MPAVLQWMCAKRLRKDFWRLREARAGEPRFPCF